jgi:lysophospholipase L1-like esterase
MFERLVGADEPAELRAGLQIFDDEIERGGGTAVLPLALASLLAGWLLAVPAGAVPIQVLAIGDSITAGVVSGPAGDPYVDVLATELGPGFEVINAGCSGASSLDWMRPYAESLPCPIAGAYELRAQPHLPTEIVTILLGGNDAVGYFENGPVPVDAFTSTMDALIDRLFGDGVGLVVLMTPPPNPGASAAVDLRLQAYGDALWTLCEPGTHVVCGLDLYELLDASLDFEGTNPHPNAAGHEKIGLALADVVRSVPEPSTALLLAFGLMALAAGRRRC